ncbi:MAG: arylsulfatase [Planctomycetaceae bacterium]|nr:arylsulfatase [Planctomycetaceae bacterium]
MDRRTFLKDCLLTVGTLQVTSCAAARKSVSKRSLPNIVYILADDLGYGDLSCLNKDSKLRTQNLDRLAEEGMIFTDAHSGSAVCTPTRYGILTGRYCWRSRLKKGVLNGYSPHLIEPSRPTVASLLRSAGYHTACIGKWHLGWDWQTTGADPKNIDYTKPIANGPRSNGFDYSFCIPASLDMAPYVYVENDRVTVVPDRIIEAQRGKQMFRKGPIAPDFKHIEVLDKLTDKADAYIRDRAASADSTPFFLYFALPAPHTPILPTQEFQGKSRTNEYGDFVLQVDQTVARIRETLKRSGIEKETLVVFTSDNGCSPEANFEELAKAHHDPSYVFRGAKADIFEGGHRIPFIAHWPSHIARSSTCNETICLTDFIATAAEIANVPLGDNAGEDSVSMLPYLLGKANGPLREATVHHSINGSFSIRQGKWKLSLCPDSGGWSKPRPGTDAAKDLPSIQLYDLSTDIAEEHNVQQEHPEIVRQLTELLESYIERGRSTPGTPQKNDRLVNIQPS